MAIRTKGSRKIVVENQEFRWLASGSDHGIDVMIWPTINKNVIIKAHLDYHISNNGDKLAITNRIIRTAILHFGVEKILASSDGQQELGRLEDIFPISDGVWQSPSNKPCPTCSERLGFETMCKAG